MIRARPSPLPTVPRSEVKHLLPADLTATQIGLMALVLVLAGMTKGALGVGLPLVAVPPLFQIVPVPLAIMTLAVSTVVSNGFKAFQGGGCLL